MSRTQQYNGDSGMSQQQNGSKNSSSCSSSTAAHNTRLTLGGRGRGQLLRGQRGAGQQLQQQLAQGRQVWVPHCLALPPPHSQVQRVGGLRGGQGRGQLSAWLRATVAQRGACSAADRNKLDRRNQHKMK